ncbi:receptor-like protein 19 [Cocos nucifera]|uniref:Receptor-like protein 19 n=1 Tax=Cocos nucifera TaxID=13894 RepID=A0A8K0IFK5_COCNU|nr:receptor-like protein 19 [Cocos nucifera]
MQPLMIYPFHFNFFRLVAGLRLMASDRYNRRSLVMERVMLIGLFIGVIPFPFCLSLGSEDGSKVGGSCIEHERRALLAIRAYIYHPGEWLSSWTGQDCCQWRGVGCDNTSGHVVKLNLRYPYYDAFNLTGKFPGPSKVNPSISSLIYLRYLDLSLNNFSFAPIPEFIGSLMHLEYLNLSKAWFSGRIPHQIGNLSRLHYLDLRSEYHVLDKRNGFLVYYPVDLHVNDLQWLSRIPTLQYIDLSFVNLSKASNWLHEINTHTSLLVLKLSSTGLAGIPSTPQHINFTSLTVLDLSHSYFQFGFPHWLINISSLVHLDLCGCNFHGRLSSTVDMLGNLNHLKYLDFSFNQITGGMSQSLWNNKHLEYLDLSYNQITELTAEMTGNLSQLRYFALNCNLIGGEIPESLGNLSHLKHLDLSYTGVSGEIPKSLGNLFQLEELSLSLNHITGLIPEEIFGKCSQLRNLYLSGNQISGEIPQNLGNLSHLERLDLFENKISGQIPESMGNLLNLEELDLSSNQIGGWLPETIGKLVRLVWLNLRGNNITGQIPRNMSNLCDLQELNIADNNIGGEITSLIEGFSKCINNKLDGRSILKRLEQMQMGNNNFSGTIPESLGQFSGLKILTLSSNFFTGYLTEVHFSNLTRLDFLDLSFNSLKMNLSDGWIPPFNATSIMICSCFVGPKFPTWLRRQINLKSLCLSEAGILDKIPSWLWYRDLYYLNVSHNCMEGQLPDSAESRIYLILDLSSNCFSGPIPNLKAEDIILSNNSFSGPISLSFAGPVFTNFSASVALRVLSLSNNHINGSIPQFLCNWTSLEVLDLSNNELSGGFPDCWICNLTSLKVLSLSNNELSGGIPNCWSKPQQGGSYPTELQSLHMRNNSLSGEFPSFLRFCKQLVTLDLGENRFSGNIPTWIGESLSSLRVLRLRSNFFDGNIPMQISSLSSLQVLDLACNNFSGNLPSSFGNFTAMVEKQEGSKPMLSNISKVSYYKESLLIFAKGLELEYTSVLLLVTSIDLSQNNLFGEIPNEVTNLHGLRFWNLSRNHFIGKIPQDIYNMRQLESLDLSMNDLCGQIPQTMLALNYLSQLNLSYNNLSGRIPSGNQFWTFNDPSIYIGNHDLCGQPLPDCPTNEPPHQDEEEIDEDDSEMIWIYASSALGFVMGFWGFIGTVMIEKDIRISYLRFIDRIYDWVYVELAIKFAELKFLMEKINHEHS